MVPGDQTQSILTEPSSPHDRLDAGVRWGWCLRVKERAPAVQTFMTWCHGDGSISEGEAKVVLAEG